MDVLDLLAGRRDPLTPPRGLWFIGGGSKFREIDEATVACLIEAGLKPSDRVLDMGCGIGFRAARLAKFLDNGSYEGFDVIRTAIDWASSHITAQHPNFRFRHADVFSRHYNPRGIIQPQDYTFPYASGTFDFVFALSLFTHLLPSSAERYLHEMSRVMKPGTTAWISAFLIDQDAIEHLRRAKAKVPMSPNGNCWVMDAAFPETAVGLPEGAVRQWCDSAGLKIARIDPGAWCGREQDGSGHNHDHIILAK